MGCTGGACQRVGVAVAGACDANQRCGPGLECHGARCALPCVCPIPACFVDGDACKKTVVGTERVREDCWRVAGVCGPPCFEDASRACKREVTRPTSRTESCAKVCP